ncbi:hypothetical protein GOBAR_AA19171 [Gossypium barbadense]|uniref:Uncharacterized protein n=1 Tax=Gossypium barbadense TaxID=3634 RepID=A0A2P5XDW7_GOSBA|nr:hypothetical protein GOBAR_AA19171 [Gossypium barbadense]
MGPTLEAKSLRKAVVPSTLLENPSPGNLQSTRLALHIPLEDSWLSTGKEGLLIPETKEVIESLLLKRCPHRSEIQSIVLTEIESTGYLVLASVDAYGHLIVSKLDASGKDADKITYSVLPRDFGVGEGSWSGMCFSPTQWSMASLCTNFLIQAAVARSFCKSVDVYDQDIHLRTLRTLWYPSSLSFMRNLGHGNESSILAVTEGCQLSVWDLRIKENGGCLNRICGSAGDIFYAVCSSSTGNIAVGGADRTVTIYDPRRWSAISRWVHCSKYEVSCLTKFPPGLSLMFIKPRDGNMITGLAFSSLDPDYIFVQGVDYEVFCGQWQESSKVFSFRGDSNWLGFSKCSNRDILGGWCDSGSIFVVDVIAKG